MCRKDIILTDYHSPRQSRLHGELTMSVRVSYLVKPFKKKRTFTLLPAVALALVAAFTTGNDPAQAANFDSGNEMALHIGSRIIELKVGSPAVSVPASALNPNATGTAQVRLVPGGDLGSRARSVLVISGGTLHPTASARSAVVPVPLDANGCSPTISLFGTCISVIGSGLTVNFWGTSAYYGGKTTCDAQFLIAGQIEQEDFFECNGPGFFQDSYLFVPTTFSGKTQICNYWPGARGRKPCETVHA
jgi:hypothetical protein